MYNPNLLTARKTVCKTTEDFRDVFEALFEFHKDDAINEMLDTYFQVQTSLTELQVLLSNRLYEEAKKEITKVTNISGLN